LLQAVNQVQTPQQFQQLQARVGMGLKDYLEKNAPKFSTANVGNAQVTTGRGGLFGEVMPELGQTLAINQSPDSVARGIEAEKAREQQAREAAAGRDVQLKIAGMADARARERLDFDKTKPPSAAAKPMPATALKMQDEDLNAIGTFAGIDKDLAGIEKQIADGKLNLGLVNNATGSARNFLGASNESSRNLATFKAKLENMRNSVLLLNKGVQTEGDAQRAMNEMIANINDSEVVKQRLTEIRALNRRAVQLKKNNVDMVRRNYGQEDMDFSKYENQPPATNLPKPSALSPEDARALEWANKNPNDPRAKAIKQRIGGG